MQYGTGLYYTGNQQLSFGWVCYDGVDYYIITLQDIMRACPYYYWSGAVEYTGVWKLATTRAILEL